METILLLTFIFISLEIFESNWQKSDTFYGMIKKNYQIYSKSLFLYFTFNPTFFYTIFLAFTFSNFSFFMSSIFILKFADISFKLHLLNKIDQDEDITALIPIDINISNIIRYMNVLIYPFTFLFAVM